MKHFSKLFVLVSMIIFSCGGSSSSNDGLQFIYSNTEDISETKCYHLHPWSSEGEIHLGIDISPKYNHLIGTNDVKMTEVVAPTSGIIEEFIVHESGAGAKMFSLAIKINEYWRIIMSFEPQTLDTDILEQQENNFFVSKGDTVTKGQVIANLV